MQLPRSRRGEAERTRPRLTYERVASTLALVLVLTGGTAFAVTTLIKGSQIAKGTITAKNIKSHSLLGLDFKAGQLPAGDRGAQGPQGTQGTQGIQGTKGDTGATGTAAASAIVEVNLQNNAEFQAGSNIGFPGPPIRKSQGVYCIPLPAGFDGNTVAAMLTPDGAPTIDVQVSASNCADETHWIEVDVSSTAGSFTLVDAPFNVALP
jgi:hypothetical protein